MSRKVQVIATQNEVHNLLRAAERGMPGMREEDAAAAARAATKLRHQLAAVRGKPIEVKP